MGVQRVVNPLAERCARRGRASPEKQSGQQSAFRTSALYFLPRLDRHDLLPIKLTSPKRR